MHLKLKAVSAKFIRLKPIVVRNLIRYYRFFNLLYYQKGNKSHLGINYFTYNYV